MTGCLAQRKDVYYVRLTYYDRNHQRKDKWVSTGLSGRGAKQKSTAMIQSLIEKYSYLEKSEHPSKMVDYLAMWKELRKSEVAETTYDGYHTYIDRHLIPYFSQLNLNIQDITAGHIFDYVNSDISTTANIYAHISHRKKISLAKDLEKTFTFDQQ